MKLFEKKYREEYVSTLRKLLDYAGSRFPKYKASEMLDSDQKYTYSSFIRTTAKVSGLLSRYGIGAGERVAIYSQNMPNWTVAFFATTAYGRVSVPILAESSGNEVETILQHSETRVLFVSESKVSKLSEDVLNGLTLVIRLDDLKVIRQKDEEFTGLGFVKEPAPDDIAGIFYTSGTTGRPKGVMLSHRNLVQNVKAASYAAPFKKKDRWLSILPMAHTYEMAFSMLYPFYVGGAVYYLKKAPTTTVLAKALAQVKPHVVCSVPLIIEKIYKMSVRKTIDSSRTLSWAEKHLNKMLYKMIGRKLKRFFGGHLKFFGIGGAKVDPTVEMFLLKAKFPYAIGYGLTETAPLITAKSTWHHRHESIGKKAWNVDVRIEVTDEATGEGEIQCMGPNVMMGYYKDPERTREVFTEDGWLKTGDLGACDKDGFYYIRGRIGTMIVGPSGENIYPEEIENVINNISGVNESLVVNRDGKLVALVKLDESVIDWDHEREERFYANLEEKKKEVMEFVNKHVRKSNNINDVQIVREPFTKTATLKIRRFLYQKKDENNEA